MSAIKTRICAGVGCGVGLTGAHGNRRFCSERCRRKQYAGFCKDCGASTNGHGGPGQAAAYCRSCSSRAYAKWSRDRIAAKIREWAELYGDPPVAEDWNPALAAQRRRLGSSVVAETRARYSAGDWPSTQSVKDYFGSWNEAIREAGFEALRSGAGRRTDRVAA